MERTKKLRQLIHDLPLPLKDIMSLIEEVESIENTVSTIYKICEEKRERSNKRISALLNDPVKNEYTQKVADHLMNYVSGMNTVMFHIEENLLYKR